MHNKAEIKASEGKVMKRTYQTSIVMRICKKISLSRNQSQIGCMWSTDSFRGKHIVLEQKIMSILGLIKKKASGSSCNMKTKNIMKRAKIFELKNLIELLNQGV